MNKLSDAAVSRASERDVSDYADWLLPLANIQSTTPGAKAKGDFDMLSAIVHSRIITATGHGLVAGDEGKPLSGTSIFDDTNTAHYPNCVLAQVIDANTLRIQIHGALDIDDGLLPAGYNLGTHGPYLYWDLSVGTYVHTRPSNSWTGVREILYVYSVGSTTFTAEVLGWAPQG